MRIRSAAKTHVGLVRKNNEDAYLCDDALGLYAVADGMGGHAAGEVASHLAIEALRANADLIRRAPDSIRGAFDIADRSIHSMVHVNSALAGMGTTLTALSMGNHICAIAHVGDSRLYLVRDGIGRQLTRDHTIEGMGGPGEFANPVAKHVLLNCLGGSPGSHRKTDTVTERVKPGDVFVLCSDGLSDYVDANEAARIWRVVREFSGAAPEQEPHSLAEELLRQSLKAGGEDNITVVVVAVEAD